jgi:hypothetical protein
MVRISLNSFQLDADPHLKAFEQRGNVSKRYLFLLFSVFFALKNAAIIIDYAPNFDASNFFQSLLIHFRSILIHFSNGSAFTNSDH